MGGPDGARDLEACYANALLVYVAVGFRNSASDSPEDKKWVINKFGQDLNSALNKNPDIKGFVFFTNVDLTPGEQEQLKNVAAKVGIEFCEIFHRERIRMHLDNPAGFGTRF